MRMKTLLTLLMALMIAIPAAAQMGGARGSAEATVGGKKVSISYGQPALKGRDMLGMAKAGMVWRLGMNEATEITSAGDLTVGGKTLKAGKYSLWAKKVSDTDWIIGFHSKTGIWGSPEMKDGYLAEMPVKATKAANSAEQLMIGLAAKGTDAELKIHWGTLQLAGSFGVK